MPKPKFKPLTKSSTSSNSTTSNCSSCGHDLKSSHSNSCPQHPDNQPERPSFFFQYLVPLIISCILTLVIFSFNAEADSNSNNTNLPLNSNGESLRTVSNNNDNSFDSNSQDSTTTSTTTTTTATTTATTLSSSSLDSNDKAHSLYASNSVDIELLMSLTDKDIEQIKARGSSVEVVEQQLENFRKGFPFTRITKPAVVGDGILRLSDNTMHDMIQLYEESLASKSCVKFVPASGAASRMFKQLFAFLDELEDEKNGEAALNKLLESGEPSALAQFFKEIHSFAFFDDLDAAVAGGVDAALKEKRHGDVLRALLRDDGLQYGSLPKALLRFHAYDNDERRTPLEEHLVEAAEYCRRGDGTAHLHFTVSPNHLDALKERVSAVRSVYEARYNVTFVITYSVQKPSTDTVAVNLDHSPFRLDDDSLLFRPAGHGALIENLNELDADMVFIKNIDNVVPDRLKASTVRYKKALGGVLVRAQQRIEAYVASLSVDTTAPVTDERLAEIAAFVSEELGSQAPEEMTGAARAKRVAYLLKKLRRPLRVCGMVPASGETGGGPFWTRDADGGASIQIVETAQIDVDNEDQKKVMSNATHFNPVDIVSSARKPGGGSYNLTEFRDETAGFISKKSLNGRELLAQELPGLWNGAQAFVNTIFVEVPLITFNPVKTVNDLLRKEHQPNSQE